MCVSKWWHFGAVVCIGVASVRCCRVCWCVVTARCSYMCLCTDDGDDEETSGSGSGYGGSGNGPPQPAVRRPSKGMDMDLGFSRITHLPPTAPPAPTRPPVRSDRRQPTPGSNASQHHKPCVMLLSALLVAAVRWLSWL